MAEPICRLGHGGPVLHPVGGFLPPAADGGHHPAVIVHDENSGLWILFTVAMGLGKLLSSAKMASTLACCSGISAE